MRILLIYLEHLDNEPLGLMYIGTVLNMQGHYIKIIGIEKNILKEISKFNPHVIGLSITTPLANKAHRIANLIKINFPEITIIAGGPHPTILPYETLNEKNIDICIIGEGEVTVVDLLRTLDSSGAIGDVKGIAFLRNDSLVITDKRDYIQDLDSLPFIDRELLPKEVIFGRAGYPVGNPCMLLMTVRGCPYRCSFCQPAVDKIFGTKVRRRSPENVIEEIIELKRKYDIYGLWINDDTFLLDNNWTEKFCDLIVTEHLDILWYANGRLGNIDKDTLIKMRDAGCAGLVLTPETGSDRIRNEILNKRVTNTEIFRTYRICHEIGIPVQANIMLASPTETEEDLNLSITLIKKIQPHFMNFSYTTALPGTHLYERYYKEISVSIYYNNYEDYDIGKFKKLDTDTPDSKLREAWDFFKKMYSNTSFSNRARHFLRFPYFRKILFRRWKTLILSHHPKFRHLFFDLGAIILGLPLYLKNLRKYESDY